MERRVIIILPAFNEEESIGELLEEFCQLVHQLDNYQIILINDGSTDRTVEIAERYKSRLNLTIINHKENRGLGPAIKTGLYAAIDHSTGDNDAIVYMDADCTHSPQYIPSMIAALEKGADVVIASRFLPGSQEIGVPFLRRVYSRGARLLFHLFLPIAGVSDFTCGYRAYRSFLIRRALKIYGDKIIERSGFACTDELLVNLATFDIKIAEVPFILRYDRKKGRSKLPLWRTIRETGRMLLKARKRLKKEKMKVL
ncbi:MAG: glycosyltransferase family 2 protein [Candidatus Sumerlaeia bacterium]|nr:glycosyltransferase family 2 protein [Candidatus Sumerlaeia bacterium]